MNTASRKILLAFIRDDEGTVVARALGPDGTARFFNRGLTLRRLSEQLLDRDEGCVIGGRDLPHRQARHRQRGAMSEARR
ncbi:hypothetical protein SHJG_p1157 (plasmid) [Streptomyces hygroscopicus subsp. jinggangensis 5008]|nr:hypothetical protein SHJG_p1157 [Streptomyces hygroscopicus subsp. jinggangensis 5008]AGF68442.1 hypothetical protein SHJGH_p1157 [Streptomyces hygroscopicus subsp. jinggangensis TL01]